MYYTPISQKSFVFLKIIVDKISQVFYSIWNNFFKKTEHTEMKTILSVFGIALLMTINGVYGHAEKKMKTNKKNHKYTNRLINESSPYLLMHAHNPVNWYPWGEEALEKARKENKLLIISIGYAACHWCHVMEEESFEDPGAAKLMNDHFVSIKVDREERPDIDQIYMNAAQLITGGGGWPLNAIALPDGRPFYAGTYFPKESWISILTQINRVYKESPEKIEAQAASLTNGIKTSEIIRLNTQEPDFQRADLDRAFVLWKDDMDFEWGGQKKAPKFPMPIGFQFLLRYRQMTGNEKALEAVKITLDRMAMGGIYDQVGGGFARYSTDSYWKVPHFEKMLYDNAQLVSLYSSAYQLTGDGLYKRVVYETLEFIERELTSPVLPGGGFGFYSSLDADSEGVEGKFYTWTKEEIKTILGGDAGLAIDYYNVTNGGNWEHTNILFRTKTDEEFAKEKGLSVDDLLTRISAADKKLLEARSVRVRPPLDDKILTSWNGLMVMGYVDAYRVFGEDRFLQRALGNAEFIVKRMMSGDGRLDRVFKEGKGKSSINGFLDDYAFTISAFISLYQATFDEVWLVRAEKLLKYVLAHFYDGGSGMFYYTSDIDPGLIARKMETTDNVIPGSNSVMAVNLYVLGEYFYNEEYVKKSRQMLNNVKSNVLRHGVYFANWGILMGYFVDRPYEVAIVGDGSIGIRKEMDKRYLPNVIFMGGKVEGKLPLLKGKLVKGQTTIYVCKDKACRLPVTDTESALKQMN